MVTLVASTKMRWKLIAVRLSIASFHNIKCIHVLLCVHGCEQGVFIIEEMVLGGWADAKGCVCLPVRVSKHLSVNSLYYRFFLYSQLEAQGFLYHNILYQFLKLRHEMKNRLKGDLFSA